ncbi:MAG: glycosyltransferase family 4 protein [Pseudomonadota bacterium]
MMPPPAGAPPLPVVLAVPGALETATGGYAYDRALLAHLPHQGIDATHLPLPGGFPLAPAAVIAAAMEALTASDPHALLLVDGLALGALPADLLRPIASRLVGLIHHPLALEAGLSAQHQASLRLSERKALSLCRAVITTSAETARILASDYDVPDRLISVAEPGLTRAPRSPAKGDPPRLLSVGTVIPRKAYPILVEALGGLRALSWTLTIVGSLEMDLSEAARLGAAISDAGLSERVRLAGALERAALEAAYGQADLFVHPSLYEGYGMVLAEALQRGLPVVCTTGGAAAQTVPDGAGVKVPPGDATALRNALAPLIADAGARRNLADRAFAAGLTFPTWDDTAARIASVLKGLARKVAA